MLASKILKTMNLNENTNYKCILQNIITFKPEAYIEYRYQ